MKYCFESDVYDWGKKTIKRLGYQGRSDGFETLVDVFTVTNTLIPLVKREVKIAKEFTCPKHLEEGYNQLIQEVLEGKDLNLRGSRKQRDKKVFVDKMLADWNVVHLHLGTKRIRNGKNKGLIGGRKELLFACFTNETAHIIGIYDHKSWVKEDIVARIANNWPELANVPMDREGLKLTREITESDRLAYRKHNINVPVAVDNKVILICAGGGLTSSGSLGSAVQNANIVLRGAVALKKWTDENISFIKEVLDDNGINYRDERLIFDVSKFILCNKYSFRTEKSMVRFHLKSAGDVLTLVDYSLAPKIEPIRKLYECLPSHMYGERNIYVERCSDSV